MKDWAVIRAGQNEARERDYEFSFLSFRLPDRFLDSYRTQQPDWGFPMGAGNTLGEWVWLTRYSPEG